MSEYPSASAALVEQKARQLFSAEDLPQVLALLEAYGNESWQREPERVRLGLLKLSGGKLEQLRHYLAAAQGDYRDVLAWAEYPEQMKHPDSGDGEAARARRERDERQYSDWLEAKADT